MGWYARQPRLLARQLVSDVVVIAWAIGGILAGRAVYGMIAALAAPSREVATSSGKVADTFAAAADDVSGTPLVGETVAKPFRAASEQMRAWSSSAWDQVHDIEQAATIAGVLIYLIPLVILLLAWLPGRINYLRDARAARRIGATDHLDLMALRAIATLPMRELARVSDDPVGAWRRGDEEVIRKLGLMQVKREGLAQRERSGTFR